MLWECQLTYSRGKSSKLVKTYRYRAATETPYLLRQHKDSIRYTLMAAFCIQRAQEITDSLIEILTTIIKRIDNRAEKTHQPGINRRVQKGFGQNSFTLSRTGVRRHSLRECRIRVADCGSIHCRTRWNYRRGYFSCGISQDFQGLGSRIQSNRIGL